MDDSSLDDFLDGDDDEGENGGAAEADPTMTDTTGDESDPTAEEAGGVEDSAVDSAAVEPAVSTYAWSAEPVACVECGTAVRRRYRDESGLVCADCKEW